jgi:hypothetical protein
VNTGWVGGGDGLLALDRNGDGVINDGSELFGSGTTLAAAARPPTATPHWLSWTATATARSTPRTARSATCVSGSTATDGVSQADELKSLTDLGITKLNLDAKQNVSQNNGNWVGITSTYETADGASHAAADVWFAQGAHQQRQPVGQQPVGRPVELQRRCRRRDRERDQAGSAKRHHRFGSGPGQRDRQLRQPADRCVELGRDRRDPAPESPADRQHSSGIQRSCGSQNKLAASNGKELRQRPLLFAGSNRRRKQRGKAACVSTTEKAPGTVALG